ncbi:hypothetical protein BYT27DRAFT_7213264 [Phlegmacium glaucopus]|nr:hypothetical protein BYT27DRAFT_7213264 [Phlegmacium glaucopus]
MFSHFWNTTVSAQDNEQIQPVTSNTMKSPRQSHASPDPIQRAPTDHLEDSQKPMRSKILKPMGFDFETTTHVPGHFILSAGPSENLMEVDTVTVGPVPGPLTVSTGPLEKPMEPNTLAVSAMAPQPTKAQVEVQRNLSRSPTPRLDMQKRRAKRRHNLDTDPTTNATTNTRQGTSQDVPMSRIAIQEKDKLIELLKNEASGQLLMIWRENNVKNMESLVQKVDHITEELKTKDAILERVQAKETKKLAEEEVGKPVDATNSGEQPLALLQNTNPHSNNPQSANSGHPLPLNPPLLFSRPTRDEDEDMYMGDSEADKLEGKGTQKKTMRKRKGKAWEVEDHNSDTMSELDMSELDVSRSDMSGSDKGELDKGEEAPRVKVVIPSGSSRVQPPYKFLKPKGGGGPCLQVKPSQVLPDTDGSSESDNPPHVFNTIPNPLNLPHDTLVALTQTILGVIGQKDILSTQKRRRKIKSEKIKQPTAMCHKEMNILLEIKNDKNIVLKTPPSKKEIEDFAEERGPGPVLKPMRLSFDVSASHAWNIDLVEQFVGQVKRNHTIGEAEESLLYELFVQRFYSLKREYNKWKLKDGEDTVQRAQRVKELKRLERGMRRKDTRRNNDRLDIAEGNREGKDGRVDPVWDFLYNATKLLPCKGMSSDESGQEGWGSPYYIRAREWQNRELILNNRPGNPPRERQRIVAAATSIRKAIPNLPKNFYDKTWVNEHIFTYGLEASVGNQSTDEEDLGQLSDVKRSKWICTLGQPEYLQMKTMIDEGKRWEESARTARNPGGILEFLVNGNIPGGFLVNSRWIPGGFLVNSWWIPGGFLVNSWWIPGGFLVDS